MRVRIPAHPHTSNAPGIEGISPVTSEGCTKIDAPIIVPTTIAVAWGRRIARRISGADDSFFESDSLSDSVYPPTL